LKREIDLAGAAPGSQLGKVTEKLGEVRKFNGVRTLSLRECSVAPPYCLRRRLFGSDQELESELEAGVR
jgi:hypothetical protein